MTFLLLRISASRTVAYHVTKINGGKCDEGRTNTYQTHMCSSVPRHARVHNKLVVETR